MLPPMVSVADVLEARNADLVVDRNDLDMLLPTHAAISVCERNGDGRIVCLGFSDLHHRHRSRGSGGFRV